MSPSPASLPVDGRDPEVFARLWARVSRPGATPIIPLSAANVNRFCGIIAPKSRARSANGAKRL